MYSYCVRPGGVLAQWSEMNFDGKLPCDARAACATLSDHESRYVFGLKSSRAWLGSGSGAG
jgi:hypothetical protein